MMSVISVSISHNWPDATELQSIDLGIQKSKHFLLLIRAKTLSRVILSRTQV